ncbi:hypothetical protein K1T71_010231 [Dendrolimus kikuchii]|uniref:Uncharacterized protein n=1 Tax=Dendrolimus kikuchii TaxID=765133 RepID=A0ACC1CR83_9NEOP|nr:hypothetical protein K1T71_010231 [Dendrolimus kikuchii]
MKDGVTLTSYVALTTCSEDAKKRERAKDGKNTQYTNEVHTISNDNEDRKWSAMRRTFPKLRRLVFRSYLTDSLNTHG